MKSSLRLLAKSKAYVKMIVNQFIYAGFALLSKAAIAKGMNPYVFVVYRQAFASLALSPFTIFDRKQDAPLSYKLLIKIFLVSLVGLTLATNFYSLSLNYISATFASAFANIVPAMTFVMAVAFRVESISMKHVHGKAKILGSILSLAGALVFGLVKGPPIGPSNHQNTSHSITEVHSKGDQIKGFILMLSSNATMSLWLILQGFVVKKYPAKLRFTTLQCFFCTLQTAVLAIILERNPSAWKLGWDINLLSVAYSGVISTGITYWLQLWAISEKGAVFTAMFTPLSLILTAIFSALIWGETLHWGSVGGIILMVIGLYIVLWGKKKESEKDQSNENTQEPKEDNRLECSTQN